MRDQAKRVARRQGNEERRSAASQWPTSAGSPKLRRNGGPGEAERAELALARAAGGRRLSKRQKPCARKLERYAEAVDYADY